MLELLPFLRKDVEREDLLTAWAIEYARALAGAGSVRDVADIEWARLELVRHTKNLDRLRSALLEAGK